MMPNQTKRKKSEGHVFISYSRKDRKNVDWIVRQLTAGGFEVWIDRRDIPGGVDWSDTITTAVTEAEFFILILSPDSIESREVMRELKIAFQSNVPIIPVRLRPVELTDSISKIINDLQQIDFWRRRQAFVEDMINSLGGLRGVASVMPNESSIAIRESARLIVELLRIAQEVSFSASTFNFIGGEIPGYYLQFSVMRDSPEIYAEAVGNANLSEEAQLSDEVIAALLGLGWQKPNKQSYGNYWRKWQVYSNRDRAAVAATVINTFLDIYGHLWGEYLQLEQIDLHCKCLTSLAPDQACQCHTLRPYGRHAWRPRKCPPITLCGVRCFGVLRISRERTRLSVGLPLAWRSLTS